MFKIDILRNWIKSIKDRSTNINNLKNNNNINKLFLSQLDISFYQNKNFSNILERYQSINDNKFQNSNKHCTIYHILCLSSIMLHFILHIILKNNK